MVTSYKGIRNDKILLTFELDQYPVMSEKSFAQIVIENVTQSSSKFLRKNSIRFLRTLLEVNDFETTQSII